MSLFYTGCVVPHVSNEAHFPSPVRGIPESSVERSPPEPRVERSRLVVRLDDPEMERGAGAAARDPLRRLDHQSLAEPLSLPGGENVEIVEERAPGLVLVEDHADESDRLGFVRRESHEERVGVVRGKLLAPEGQTIGAYALVEVLVRKRPSIGAPPAFRVKRGNGPGVVRSRAPDVPGIGTKLSPKGIEVPEDPEAFELAVPGVEQGRAYWDGANDFGEPMPPGSYFLRIEAGGLIDSKKIVKAR